jgi:HD-GYP domain-containing protein (c-di-GMP phosphodiesterase class II)
LIRANEGHVEPTQRTGGTCDKGFQVAAQPIELTDGHAVLVAVESAPTASDTDLETDVLTTADTACELVDRIRQLVEENTSLAEEILRSYEQLNLVFDVTREIARVTDGHELELILLTRLGILLDFDLVYMLCADGTRRRYDVAAGRITNEGPNAEVEQTLADEIERVRKTHAVRVPLIGERNVILAPVVRLSDETDVLLATRRDPNTCYTSGDMLLLESTLSYGAELIRNSELQGSLKQTAIESIRALVNAIDKKDHYTCGHSERVAFLAKLTGKQMGLSPMDLELLEWAGNLHDVGKIGVAESIVNKPGRLTDEEFAEIKKHPEMGYEILKPVASFKPILEATLYHHENPDGTGYPHGLKGDDIPIAARIMRAADVFDALYSNRAYRKAFPLEKVYEIIRNDAGTKIDAESAKALLTAVDAFRASCPDRFIEMYEQVRGPNHVDG